MINIKEEEGDLEFIHDINIVVRGYRRLEATGIMPSIHEVLYVEETFETDVLKLSKAVSRQLGYLIGGQED